ncbi:hypothetical protein DCC85_14365 [Paenibacillus sp. CAA11]|uniref:hypothetical protein n=1 Tax=Paenibacillus sp. CAA11 TaxID=1532905 RepID=UPI000D399CCB|nr:hypothetical protein [Paenibacillus sp. CAA11]AWB45293.1 hypothetical protein DCC85_14365 [Paenibacillus sp. CAA11]
MTTLAYKLQVPTDVEAPKGNLRDVWTEGYFWVGAFTKGTNNRLMLSVVTSKLTGCVMTMAEKRTTISDLTGYYEYITGESFPDETAQRLKAWISAGYDPLVYTFMSEKALAMVRNKHERYSFEERGNNSAGLDGTPDDSWTINGRHKGGMIVASD